MTLAYLKYICAQKHKLDWNNISENEGLLHPNAFTDHPRENINSLEPLHVLKVSQVEFYKLD